MSANKPLTRRFFDALAVFRNGSSDKPTLPGTKTPEAAWFELQNPLRGLSLERAQEILDSARNGIYAELTYLYNEIEQASTDLMVCAERREAAIGDCTWKINISGGERLKNYDAVLAKEQKAFLAEKFYAADQEIADLAEHLDSAFFRGFAHARPTFEGPSLVGFEKCDPWLFALDKEKGDWWYNPKAESIATHSWSVCDPRDLITVQRRLHIDYPALFIFIREAIGEKQWGRFIERYGIPPVTIIMPELTEAGQEDLYFGSAEKVARGGSGALPYGSQIHYATEARGTDPFSNFLRHQQEKIVLLATGGILTSLTAAGSGTLAGNAHEKTFRTVVRRDIRAVSRAINNSVSKRMLEAEYRGRAQWADFEFVSVTDAADTFEIAAKAKAAGYCIEKSSLEELTGHKLEKDEPPTQQYGMGGAFSQNKGEVILPVITAEETQPSAELFQSLQDDLQDVAVALAGAEELDDNSLAAISSAIAKTYRKPGKLADALETALAGAFVKEITPYVQ